MRVECRHCGARPIVKVALPEGCFVFPNDKVQYLCAQHFDRLDNEHEVLASLDLTWKAGAR